MNDLQHCNRTVHRSHAAIFLKRVLPLFVLLCVTTSSSADEIEDLLRELGAPQRAARLAAEQKLLRLGPAILPKLPPRDQITDPAIREALLRIRAKFNDQQTRQTLQASLLTLEGAFTLEQVLNEIERQTANHIELSDSARGKLTTSHTLRLNSVPFWEALQNILQEFSLRLSFPEERANPLLVPRETAGLPPLAIMSHGPYLWIWERAELRPGNATTSGKNLLRCHLLFAVEPRLRGLFATFSPGEMPLRTPDGKQLAPLNPDASYELPLGEEGHAVRCDVNYILPTDTPQLKLNWEGKFSLLIAAGQERFELRPDHQKSGDSQRQGEVAVTFFPVELETSPKTSAKIRIPLAVTYDRTGPAFESHRLWIFKNRAELKTAGGETLSPKDCETRLQQQNVVLMDYRFTIPEEIATRSTFIYFAPTRIVTESIPFTFTGISPTLKPLPTEE